MEKIVKVLNTGFVTHNVKRFVVEKPEGYSFTPGQATSVSINKPEWDQEKRPFTFTSLNQDKILEFIIKQYPDHNGVTQELHRLDSGDELIIRDAWGTINYKNLGVFIAGGAGITPFISIFRDLEKKNQLKGNSLIFSNKLEKDIILEKELKQMFGQDLILTITDEKSRYKNKRIDLEFLKEKIKDFSQTFYICGPKSFNKDIIGYLQELGADIKEIVFEK